LKNFLQSQEIFQLAEKFCVLCFVVHGSWLMVDGFGIEKASYKKEIKKQVWKPYYYKCFQAITTEISEIVGVAAALSGA